MSGSCKPTHRCFGGDIPRLLQPAEAGQKADILTYSSGHLRPPAKPEPESAPQGEKYVFPVDVSEPRRNPPKPLTLRRTKALTSIKGREIKESFAEYSTGTASKEPQVSRSRQDHERSSQRGEAIRLPVIVHCSPDSVTARPRVFSQRQSGSLTDVEGQRQFSSSQSERGQNIELKLRMKQGFGRKVKQELWAGVNVAEAHERKLEKELRKLSAQRWPSRERLAVFSDVFDDVCESSPVFGRILREIKTDYDLYVNHMMSSTSSLLSMSDKTSLKDASNAKVRERELEDAEKEVCTLEEEVRRALEENKRLQNELQNVPAIIMGPEDCDLKNASVAIDGAGSVESKRLQVLNTWREIQQLEEEVEQKLVSTATTAATERRIKDVKTDTMRLIASNDRLRTSNKKMENHINKVLDGEKASKALRRMLWDEIHGDLQTEQLHEQVNQRATV